MTLAALALAGVTIEALLGRVPFEDAALERSLNLPPGACARARASQLTDEPGRRLATYLARYVVEGAIVTTDVAMWEDTPDPRRKGDEGLRLFVRCPTCHQPYVLGGVNVAIHIETGHRDPAGLPLDLVYYTGDKVRCPAATHGRCSAPAEEWVPWPVRVHPSISAVEAL